MKKIAYLFITALLMSMPLFAQAPKTINYQGFLEDAGGPVNGATDLRFTIWDANTAGNQEWGPENLSPTITDGVFNVTLGQSTPINLNWDEEYWLQIVVDPTQANQTLPRVRIASGGYSLTTQRIEATDAAGQSAITAINLASSGTINTARLNSEVVLDTENPNASGDISGDFSNGLTIVNNSVGADELNVSGDGTAGEILSSDGDGTFSWVADQTGGGGGSTIVFNFDVFNETTSNEMVFRSGGLGGSTIIGMFNIPLLYSGSVEGFAIICQNAAASTDIKVYINGALDDTQTVNLSSGNTVYTGTFNNVNFNAGDYFEIRVDPTNAPGPVALNIFLEVTP